MNNSRNELKSVYFSTYLVLVWEEVVCADRTFCTQSIKVQQQEVYTAHVFFLMSQQSTRKRESERAVALFTSCNDK